jgi:hypothetical protein
MAGDAKRWNRIAISVLPLVAAVGAVLSWGSLYQAAATALGAHAPAPFGINLAGAAFPMLVDALILGASARYVAGVQAGRPVGGWRIAAHAGVTGTVLLNAAASPTLADIPWHVTAPIVWSVMVELVARDILGELREVSTTRRGDRIPWRLWLTSPAESARVSWRIARTGDTDVDAVRAVTERAAAARDHLATALPGRRHRRTRRQITRRLWAGALDPATLVDLIDTHPSPAGLHGAVLRAVATGPTQSTSPETVQVEPPVRTIVPVAACESGPVRVEAPVRTVLPDASGRPSPPLERSETAPDAGPGPSARTTADLEKVIAAVAEGRIEGRVTKAKIREHLRCSNPHAGQINTLYQQHHSH